MKFALVVSCVAISCARLSWSWLSRLPAWAELRPSSTVVQLGLDVARVLPIWAHLNQWRGFGRIRPNLVRVRRMFGRIRTNSGDLDRVFANFGQEPPSCGDFSKLGAKSSHILVEVGRTRPTLVTCRPNSTRNQPKLGDGGKLRTKSSHILLEDAQVRPNVDRIGSEFGHNLPRHRPSLGCFGRSRHKLDQVSMRK